MACFFEAGVGIAPTLSVEDNIHLYGSIIGLDYQDTRNGIHRILEFSELSDQCRTTVEHLSFGTQQRLFFSIMLYAMQERRSDVFLFDEWLAGADARFRKKGQRALERLRGDGVTAIYASHDLSCLEEMCEFAIYVRDGRVAGAGPFREVVDRYESDQALI